MSIRNTVCMLHGSTEETGYSDRAESIAPACELRENNNMIMRIRAHDDSGQTRRGTTMTVLKRDMHYHTYADYLTWSRSHGDELIDGTAYVREPPSPTRSHQEIVGELYHQAAYALEDRLCRVYVAPFDVRLPKSTEEDDQVDTVVQPDVLIVSDLKKLDARGMRGAPDWVAEVLSPSTARHDQSVKLSAYERAGVREVWFIDPIDRTLTIYQLEAGCYGRATIRELKGRTQLAAVPGVTINWARVLAKMS
jgi:Uma2 family endonuclease